LVFSNFAVLKICRFFPKFLVIFLWIYNNFFFVYFEIFKISLFLTWNLQILLIIPLCISMQDIDQLQWTVIFWLSIEW
jgi:hypothetical protein